MAHSSLGASLCSPAGHFAVELRAKEDPKRGRSTFNLPKVGNPRSNGGRTDDVTRCMSRLRSRNEKFCCVYMQVLRLRGWVGVDGDGNTFGTDGTLQYAIVRLRVSRGTVRNSRLIPLLTSARLRCSLSHHIKGFRVALRNAKKPHAARAAFAQAVYFFDPAFLNEDLIQDVIHTLVKVWVMHRTRVCQSRSRKAIV
ncbi:hypothetical protein B0H13DRAFT_2560542 [Mycena leptocephala]|nr:hypothetical protein B0H13DRAFT_2560542 [Mycena leptocephala]